MKIYLVGGAVRDALLGREIKEKDWVVVGATPAQMIKLGYRQVGKDFPVFLHPKTNEEYALARTERKIGRGYTGFEFDASPHVALEEDLIRRDLTINAIAQNQETQEIIDPFSGQQDLKNKILRHVSEAFVEDPVRILRVARLAARFAELNFKVAPETNQLMQQMVHSGEVDALVAERVWKELERALTEKNPEAFFYTLENCGALSVLFPGINVSDDGMQALRRAVKLTTDPQVRFAALLYNLDEFEIKKITERYRVPSDYKELALLVSKYLSQYIHIDQDDQVIKFFRELDVFRREDRALKFVLACRSITQNEKAAECFMIYLAAAKSVEAKKIAAEFKGKEIAEQLDLARQKEIDKIRKA